MQTEPRFEGKGDTVKQWSAYQSRFPPYYYYRIAEIHGNGDVTVHILKTLKSKPFIDRWPKRQIDDILPAWELIDGLPEATE